MKAHCLARIRKRSEWMARGRYARTVCMDRYLIRMRREKSPDVHWWLDADAPALHG